MGRWVAVQRYRHKIDELQKHVRSMSDMTLPP